MKFFAPPMLAVVVISHSRALAQEVCRLAAQAAPQARLFPVGGCGEGGTEFGTDALAVAEVLRQADSPAGTLLLMDLGSALLSAETALDLVGPELAARCRLCWAPLVEGAISAAVQAAIGSSLPEVLQEASAALTAKRQYVLGELAPPFADEIRTPAPAALPLGLALEAAPPVSIPADCLQQSFTISNLHGLHARPAALLVRKVAEFQAEVYFSKGNSPLVSARSLNATIKLNLRQGEQLRVLAWGVQAQQLLDSLTQLVAQNFAEGEEGRLAPGWEPGKEVAQYGRTTPRGATNTAVLPLAAAASETGGGGGLLCVSPGIALGKIWRPAALGDARFTRTDCDDVAAELHQLQQLLQMAESRLCTQLESAADGPSREILQLQQLLLRDPELQQFATQEIHRGHYSAAYAWHRVCEQQAAAYRAIPDNPYLQGRAADLLDVDRRVLQCAAGVAFPQAEAMPAQAILFAHELLPADLCSLEANRLRGIVTREGGINTHAAIMARAHGVPMLCGYHGIDDAEGEAIVDAIQGRVLLQPDAATRAHYHRQYQQGQQQRQQLRSLAHQSAITRDGFTVSCLANVGEQEELAQLAGSGAEGVGLLRSEYLFLRAGQAPNQQQQSEFYRRALESLPGKRVVIRLLDVGSDKALPYVNQARETNPALGLRGVRFLLAHRALLLTQLRALLLAAPYGKLAILLPMVSELAELQQVAELLQGVQQELQAQGLPTVPLPPLGVMIETPASVQLAAQLSQQADFFSVGSNDLSQHLLAAERGNSQVAHLCDAAHPALLRALQQLCLQAERSATPVSICGEAAADVAWLPLLLGLGIDCLSAAPLKLPLLKHTIRQLNRSDCRLLLERACDCSCAPEVRRLVTASLPWLAPLSGL